MARLIPRKQIEEQQNITGSLTIGENLFLGNDAVVSGSIFVSKSFFFGNDTGSKNEITGSVFLTGSLVIEGELNLANLTQLSATASNALESVDTQRYSGILAKDFGANQPTLYVSSTDGDDTNDGRTIQYPLRTIKRAAQLSSPGYDGRYGFDTASISNGYVIKVQAGTYLEDNPVILPKNTTIWGAGLRITKINAKNPTEDLFWVNAGCYVAEVTMGGLRLFPDQINPEKGFAIAFQPGAFITTSPYIQNCSQISNQENSFTELYEDIPPGGGGLYVNGDVIHPDSPLASMVLDAYTQISPNGVGCLVNGRGFIQLVSFFTNFSYYAIRVNNGGHATLNNSNISFGLFGMYASGSRFISGSGGNIAARDSVRGTWSCVVDVLNKGLEAGLPSTTKLNTDEGIRLSQPSVLPQYTVSSNVPLSPTAADEISSDFKLISEIVDKGTSDFPTLLARSSNKGYGFDSPYNILGAEQITSSLSSASLADLTNVSESYRVLLSIFANGTGSYKLTSSADLGVKITDTAILPLGTPSYLSSSVSSSFATILNILKGNKRTISSGTPYLEVENTLLLSTLPPITSSNSASIYVGGIEPFSTGLSSSLSVQNKVSASFSIITNILERGTGSVILPIPQNHQREYTIINNNSSSYQWSGVGSTTNTNPTTPNIFTVTNNGSGNYVINGQSNPTLSLIEGQTYIFNINASGHPFWIKTNISLGTGDAYTTGVTNNGTANGTITFVVPIGAPTLYYNCQLHSSMAGTINTLSSNITTTTTTAAPNNTVTTLTNNPTITLYRGETYKLYVSASSVLGGVDFPFFIRTKPLSGISEQFDYDKGVVNNGDSVGTITFSVPYDAPNELYYVSQNYSAMAGKFHIINNSATPFDLISNTLTYPKIISGSNVSTENVDILNAYEILTGSKSFIQEEVIQFVSSSWSTFDYTESIFRSNVGFVINAVCEDLLYGGNINSINAGKFYDEYVSNKTIVENDATVTAIKYVSGLGNNLVKNKTFTDIDTLAYNSDRKIVAENLFINREFIQKETIAFLSSSWSNFYYNEEKCKRDTGYILDAVITDLKYGGNERSVIAGKFYYDYPSLAIVEGDGDGEGQLGQTLDGIRYAAGLATNIVKNKTLNSPSAPTQAAYDLLRDNKSLIQNETIQFINVAFPQLKYNQATCKRDVGYIIDAISTDLLYGGNERAVTAGRYYYDYPSLATSVQRRETTAGIRYAKIIGDFVIQNIILDTPRIISNDEKNIKVSDVNNTTSSFSGTAVEQLLVSSSFGIIKNIVLRGLGAIQSSLALDTGLGWSKTNPFNISSGVQITNVGTGSYVSSSLNGFNIVTNIINSGSSVAPTIVSNTLAGIKATTELQYTASNSASNSDKSIVSASFGNIINIVTNGTGSIPNTTLNTNRGVKVTNISQITSSITPSGFESVKVTNGFNLVLDIIENGTGSLPTIIQNASNLVKRTNSTQFVSTASISQTYITASKDGFNLISDIVEYGTGSLPALVRNVEDLVRITDTIRYSSSYAISSSNVDNITSKFNTVISILENGTGSLPNIILNTSQSIKVTSANQYISASSATENESTILSASIAIVTNIVANGTGSAIVSASLSFPTSSYVTVTSSSNKLLAYEILKNNISFIQDETIAYLSSSWSTASYDEVKCRRDIGLIISGAAEDLIFNSNSASLFNGIFYYDFPSQAQGAQLNQTLDGINYASKLAQKVILNTPFVLPTSQSLVSRDILVNNKLFIQNETIAYLSSSWSSHSYNEGTCKRDIGHIIDAVATDTIYGGNERTVNAGVFYYLYPSDATGSQLDETVTGINYSKNLADKLLRGNQFIKVAQNKLQAKELITRNKGFIQNEVIEYVSASWSGFLYNETTCKRDVGYILDAIATDVVYGGNERSLEAGEYYYRYPSQATTTQLGPTLAGIEHSKGLVNEILQNKVFILPTTSAQTAFNLINNNKGFIQSESIAYVSSSWSFFEYNDIKCARDIGYILDAVATDTLYGGNERTSKAGEYYYLYPSLAIVEGDGDGTGQLGQTLDGINYAKGITQKIVSNFLLQSPTTSELDGYDLLFKNKKLIQSESIAYLSSSWSTFEYNQTTCKRDLSYIIDAVATDLKYGGNQRTNKAGEYYYLYPSLAVVANTTTGQLEQTVDGIRFAAGISDKIVSNTELIQPQSPISASASLIRQNRAFIQNETIEYIDAFYPYLIYNREKCRRDTGYILDAVITDLFYGGNERSVIAGRYYYEYPSLAITNAQKKETVNGIEYAKSVTELVSQNIKLVAPILQLNTDDNIKVTNTTQYSSSLSGSITEVSNVSSSFKIVTDIIENGLSVKPNVTSSVESLIKVTNAEQFTASISASGVEVDIVTSSFKLIRDIIYNGSSSVPDSLAANFDYGFQLQPPATLHIASINQILGNGSYDIQTGSVSSSFGTIINIVKNGVSVSPSLSTNTSASLKRTEVSQYSASVSASTYQLDRITTGYDIILDIVENGYSVVPTLITNTSSSIKVTESPQLISGSSADRLQGKLISASFGLVIDILLNGTGSAPTMISGSGANSNPKINAAYNLLLGNKSFIVSESIAYLSSSWSTFEYNQQSCSRDLSGIIDGAAIDLLYGGNSASLFNGKFYYEFPSQASGTGSQVQQTVTVLRYASQIAEKVVRNTLLQHISASVETSASYVSFTKNKEFIQSESIAYLSSSWKGFDYNEVTCKRDIGYVIDAVATDLLYGGNERAIIAGNYYYDYPSQAITTQLEPTLTGIRFGKGTALNVVVNKQYFTASADVSSSYTLLVDNRNYIQSESVAFVNAKYPNLEYSESKCLRDVGFIVDAVATDLLYGGNERSRKAGLFYNQYPSEANGTGSQIIETTAAIEYASRLSTQIINSVLIPIPQPISNTIGLIKKSATNQYISSSVNSESGSVYEASLISASISIVTDIIVNGTGSIATPIDYTTPSTASNVYYAYNLVKQNLEFIQNETIAYLSSSWSSASYDEVKCKRDIGLIVSGAIEDVLFGVNSASLVNGKFYWEYPSQANGTGSQIQQTLDGIFYASRLVQNLSQNKIYVTASSTVSASYELLRNNRQFIQSESIAYLSSSWSEFEYSQSTCMRDITHIIDAVSTDLYYGGNERSVIAGDFYYRYPSTATTAQLEPTVTGVDYAKGLASKLIQNKIFVTASQNVSASVNLLRLNKGFIQDETLAYLTASWSTFEYDKIKCRRDVGYILDAVTTDLLYSGNERSVEAGDFYYRYPSLAVVEGDGDGTGQLGQTIDGIKYASRLAQKKVTSTTFVTASLEASASFDLLRKNKSFIQNEVIAYVSSSWSGVYYNELTCKRDVGYLIDAAATDVLYGGQERSVVAGSYYYLYPSNAIRKGVPSTSNQLDPTLTGIRWAGRLAKKVIINPTFQLPSASLVTTVDLLKFNKTLIQKETITFISSSWTSLNYNEASCSRDLGFILDAIRTDLVYGGNERSIEAGSYYYKFPSVAIYESYNSFGDFGQKKQTVEGINFARGLTEKIVANRLLTYLAPATKRRQAGERLRAGKDELKQRAIGYTNGAFPYLVYNEASCSRDTGLIVDACVTDLLYGGNERGIAAASSYYNGQFGNGDEVIFKQRLETLEANRYLRTKAEFIVAGAPLESFGSLIVATGIDYSYNGSGVTFKALPPNQGGNGVPNPAFEITELGGGRIFFTSGNQDGDFRIGTGLSINQATGTLVGRTFSKSLFSLVTPFSLALQI